MKKFQIDSDGITVWVNSPLGLLGRFGLHGIDIHKEVGQQSNGECLYCTHKKTAIEDWKVFVTKMKEIYQINIPAKHKPKRL